MLKRTELFIKYASRNNSIKPPRGGAYSKLDLQEGGLILEGALIQKEAFLRGDLFETHIMVQDGLVVPGKYIIAKGPKKRLEVPKKELDKRAIKLNYMKLDIGVIMQKNILKNL